MPKFAILLVLFLLTLLFTPIVQAQSPSPKTKNLMERKEEVKSNKNSKTKKINLYWTIIRERHEATIKRLEKVILRLEQRIVKTEIESEDLDITSAKEELANAKDMLEEAKDSFEALNDNMELIVNTEFSKETFFLAKENSSQIKSDLKEVHKILVHIIGNLKGLRVGNSKSATAEGETE